MRTYSAIKLKDSLKINQFYVIEYHEASDSFELDEDIHDFWELSYVDEGKLSCVLQEQTIELNQGDLFLLPPNTVHKYKSSIEKSSSLLFLGFSSSSPILKHLQGKHKLSDSLKEILVKLISEIKGTFTFKFNSDIHFLQSTEFGGQQLTQNYLTELLIKLSRGTTNNANRQYVLYVNESSNELVNKILSYLKENLYDTLNLEVLSERLFYTKAYLNRIFKKYIGLSIKNYYNYLKIEEAQKLLRSQKISTAEISDKLQFDSPSYFIKVFKKYTNRTPNEYRKKIL